MDVHATADPGLAERKLFVVTRLFNQLVDDLDQLQLDVRAERLGRDELGELELS
jgi:hypothetical protein